MSQQDPMGQLRRANPVPLDPTDSQPGRNKLLLTGQVLLAVIGIFVVGVGAAWAATGTNPVASIFGNDIKVVDSDYGLSSISTLEPATRESFEELPHKIAFHAMTKAVTKTIYANSKEGLPPFHERGPDRSEDFDPIPADVSAIGRGSTTSKMPVYLMAIEGEICTYLGLRVSRFFCGTLPEIQQGLVRGFREPRTKNQSQIFGIVTDEVASVQILGSGLPPEPISSNTFDLRNVTAKYPELVAFDEDDNELFRCSNRAMSELMSEREYETPLDCQ